MQNDKDYYRILGCNPNASFDQIKEAYLFKVNILHPDRLAMVPQKVRDRAEKELKEVNRAYEILSNPKSRSQYDADRGFGRAEIVTEHQETGTRSTITARPKPEIYPKTVKFNDALPYVWQKGAFFIRNVGGPFSKVSISNPEEWIKITETRPLEAGHELPMEVKVEVMGVHWGKRSSAKVRVRLDEVEAVVNIELHMTKKPTH